MHAAQTAHHPHVRHLPATPVSIGAPQADHEARRQSLLLPYPGNVPASGISYSGAWLMVARRRRRQIAPKARHSPTSVHALASVKCLPSRAGSDIKTLMCIKCACNQRQPAQRVKTVIEIARCHVELTATIMRIRRHGMIMLCGAPAGRQNK